jgi:putative ABC transport system permease protein
VRQLLTESVLLACTGGVCGLLLAIWGTRLATAILPNYMRIVPLHRPDEIGVDATVLLFTSSASIFSGLVFGLAPAFASFRREGDHPLTESARGSTGGKSRLRYGLVASEMALTLVVLAGAGIMIMSVARILGVDPGLDPRNVLVMQMSLPQEDLYNGPPGHPRFCDDLDERVGGVPGVASVSAIAHVPLGGGGAGRGLAIEGQPDPGPDRQPGAGYTVACPNILRTMGIRLLAGREFTRRDTVEAPGVALINQAMAARFWPNEDAIGKRFKIGRIGSDNPWLTVAGVFTDIRHWGLDSETGPSFIRPYSQAAWPSMSVVVKTASAPAAFVTPVKAALRSIEPNQPVSTVRTMEEIVGTSVASRRFPMILLSGFALLALVLSAVGIAGVVGYSVVQRTPEIGVRVALGAQTGDVLRLVLGHSIAWTLGGIAVGLILSFGLLRFLRTLLFGVAPTDPVVLGGVSLVLVGVALAASYVPARRAMRVDPVAALRRD